MARRRRFYDGVSDRDRMPSARHQDLIGWAIDGNIPRPPAQVQCFSLLVHARWTVLANTLMRMDRPARMYSFSEVFPPEPREADDLECQEALLDGSEDEEEEFTDERPGLFVVSVVFHGLHPLQMAKDFGKMLREQRGITGYQFTGYGRLLVHTQSFYDYRKRKNERKLAQILVGIRIVEDFPIWPTGMEQRISFVTFPRNGPIDLQTKYLSEFNRYL